MRLSSCLTMIRVLTVTFWDQESAAIGFLVFSLTRNTMAWTQLNGYVLGQRDLSETCALSGQVPCWEVVAACQSVASTGRALYVVTTPAESCGRQLIPEALLSFPFGAVHNN
jgi:hypothetical protein